MRLLKHGSFLICLILTTPNASYSQTTDEVLKIINANISDNSAGKNIAYYELINKEGYFDTLNCTETASILHKIGVSLYLLDQNIEAAQFYVEKVLPIWENCPNRNDTDFANSLYNTGVSYQFADNFHLARPYFHKSLNYFEKDTTYSPIRLSTKYAGIARFYQDAQSYVRAVDYYKSAITLVVDREDSKSRLGRYHQDLGVTLNEMSNFSEAQTHFEKAILIFGETNDVRRLGMSYHNIAVSLLGLDSLDMADNYVRKAALLHKDRYDFLSNDLELMGAVEFRKGKFKNSAQLHKRALELRKQIKNNRRAVSSSYENFTDLYRNSNLDKAKAYIDSAIFNLIINPVINDKGNPIVREIVTVNDVSLIKYMGIKAKLYTEDKTNQQNIDVAIDLYSSIDSLLSANLFDLHFEKSRLVYLEFLYEYYSDAIEYFSNLHEIYPKKGYARLAFKFSTKTKSLVLLNELKGNEWFRVDGNQELENKKNLARLKAKNLYSSLIENNGADSELKLEYLASQRELETIYESIDQFKSAKNPLDLPLVNSMSISDIQQHLHPDQLYIEYFLGDSSIYIFCIDKEKFIFETYPQKEQLSIWIDSLNNLITSHDSDILRIQELSNSVSSLLIPIGYTRSESIREWIIVADGFLHQFAFDLLPSIQPGHKYIIEDVAITTGYSPNLFFNNKSTYIQNKYVGFGTTYSNKFSQNLDGKRIFGKAVHLANLPKAEDEIVLCAEIMKGRLHLGDQASKEAFEENWKKNAIVHLALHGYVDINYYEKSCMIFDDRSEDNILFLSELDAKSSECRLVVLSSCYTASGQIFKGEGIQGLTKSFLKSGNTTVISSLWSASDLSASTLIPSLFEIFNNEKSISQALRSAKLKYLKEASPSQQHPFYWANFQLVGQGNLKLKQSSNYYWLLILLAPLAWLVYKRPFGSIEERKGKMKGQRIATPSN